MSNAVRRVKRDLTQVTREPSSQYTVEVAETDLLKWAVHIRLNDGLFNGIPVELELLFPETFPFKGPTAKITSKMFHPNISSDGKICLSILTSWTPVNNAKEVIEAVIHVLQNPDPENALNADAAAVMTRSVTEYENRVKQLK